VVPADGVALRVADSKCSLGRQRRGSAPPSGELPAVHPLRV